MKNIFNFCTVSALRPICNFEVALHLAAEEEWTKDGMKDAEKITSEFPRGKWKPSSLCKEKQTSGICTNKKL